MKPATLFQKMRERRVERERLAREVATADLRSCEVNLMAALAGFRPPHRTTSNYQECLQMFATFRQEVKARPNWRVI